MQRGHAGAYGVAKIVERPARDTRFAIEDRLQPLLPGIGLDAVRREYR